MKSEDIQKEILNLYNAYFKHVGAMNTVVASNLVVAHLIRDLILNNKILESKTNDSEA